MIPNFRVVDRNRTSVGMLFVITGIATSTHETLDSGGTPRAMQHEARAAQAASWECSCSRRRSLRHSGPLLPSPGG